jgi:hypothetical protein
MDEGQMNIGLGIIPRLIHGGPGQHLRVPGQDHVPKCARLNRTKQHPTESQMIMKYAWSRML